MGVASSDANSFVEFTFFLWTIGELLNAWEQDKMNPLWQEGERYTVMRYQYHTQRFKTGEIDPKIDGKALKRKFGKTNPQ